MRSTPPEQPQSTPSTNPPSHNNTVTNTHPHTNYYARRRSSSTLGSSLSPPLQSSASSSFAKPLHDPRNSLHESRRRSTGASHHKRPSNGSATRITPSEREPAIESPIGAKLPLSPTRRRRFSHHSPGARGTNRSPPPTPSAESIPTLPRLTFDPTVFDGSEPFTPLSATFAAGDAGRSFHRGSVQGLGAAFEPRKSPRTTVAAEGGKSPRYSGSGAGGERAGVEGTADMSSRRRSMSSGNTSQPHEAVRNYDAEAGSERNGSGNRISGEGDAPKGKDRREQDKKSMLSKALQKAHQAVLLDNAHNFEGAIEAYDDACRLLGQVLLRSTGEDDRRKLDAIRTTYTNRIQELHQINREAVQAAAANGKNLPTRPMSDDSISAPHDTPQSHRSLEPEPRVDSLGDGQAVNPPRSSSNTVALQSAKPESSAISQPKISEPPPHLPPTPNTLPLRQQSVLEPPATFRSTERFLTVGSPMDAMAPPPLSPRRLQPEPNGQAAKETPAKETLQPPSDAAKQHSRGSSGGSISWLDTIDESGASSDGSSVHSVRKGTLRRKHVRLPSGDTEAEFDAALDAAVEAAYADGMEPYDEYDEPPLNYEDAKLSEPVRAMVDTERKRLSDRSQIIQQAHARTKQLVKEGGARQSRELYRISDGDLDADAEGDEEERILEEISKDFGFDFGLPAKSSMPRQSDSSEYSAGSTYHSSMSSSKNTATTSLSTVNESLDAQPKANQNLPRLSEEESRREVLPLIEGQPAIVMPGLPAGSVRSRRMSGQNAKQLKIETQLPGRTKITPAGAVTAPPTSVKMDDSFVVNPSTARSDTQILPDTVFKPSIPAPLTTPLLPPQTFVTQSSPPKADNDAFNAPIASPTTPAPGFGFAGENNSPRPDVKQSKDRPNVLKKNKSSVSLKMRTLSMSSPDGSEVSVGTPLSTTFSAMSAGSKKNMTYTDSGAPPTPSLANFGTGLTQTASNVNLFESDLHSPYVPGSPNPLAINAPIPLEPCPDSHLLRPYWLMRCFYQTIAHPRGGYLSTKLFVPRDVWRVKGVKIKGMDDKIANCDYLTSALQKLGSVDTFDADAVMDEMQQFELVLDQVQSNLTKKLGNEVSVQGIQTLFKDAPVSSSTDGASPIDGAASVSGSRVASQGKGFVSSWRKLRSKSSAVNLSSAAYAAGNGKSGGEGGVKESLTMSTLPMTSLPNPRFARREVKKLEVAGPHAQYMESLARLCDAVQVIDQIARQVEDPGLKHSSPTHVGLELSTRHASEFFGFFICRFVLTDLTMLLDKFIKRGSEWVLV